MLSEAVRRTANNRNYLDDMLDASEIINEISAEEALKKLWRDYQEEYSFSRDIDYEDLMGCIAEISERLTLNGQARSSHGFAHAGIGSKGISISSFLLAAARWLITFPKNGIHVMMDLDKSQLRNWLI